MDLLMSPMRLGRPFARVMRRTLQAKEPVKSMRSRTLLPVSVIAALMASSASAQAVWQTDAKRVASLCPALGLPGVFLGEPRSSQDPGLAERLNNLPPAFAPFTEADLDFTPWSDQLASVTYHAASPDAAANKAWAEALGKSLLLAGWTVSARKELASPLGVNARLFEKEADTSQGKRTMLVEFDTPGARMLRCGDVRLLELAKIESEGRLESGSRRPVAPQNNAPGRMPNEADCMNPALLAAFRQPRLIDETVPEFRELAAGGELISEQRRFGDRMHTWLVWKLLGSGQISQERIWELEDMADPEGSDGTVAMQERTIEALGMVAQAQSQNDPSKVCKSLVKAMIATAEKDGRDVIRWAKVNQALETEAQRLGIDVR